MARRRKNNWPHLCVFPGDSSQLTNKEAKWYTGTVVQVLYLYQIYSKIIFLFIFSLTHHSCLFHSQHQLREVLPSEHSNFPSFPSSSPVLTHFHLTCDPASLNHERINRSSIFQLKIRGENFSNRRMMMLVVVVFFR